MNKKNRVVKKCLTREATLIGLEAWYEGIVQRNELFFSTSFPTNVFVLKQGVAEVYKDEVFNMDVLPRAINLWIENNTSRVSETWIPMVKALILVDQLDAESITTAEEGFGFLVVLRKAFIDGCQGLITTFWVPMWQEHYRTKGESLFSEDIVKNCLHWRNKTDGFSDKTLGLIKEITERIFELKEWDPALSCYISFGELRKLLKDEIDLSEFETRKNQSIILVDGNIVEAQDNNCKAILSDFGISIKQEECASSTHVKGESASLGLVKGRVVVSKGAVNFDKIEKGSILVAPMTTPNYIPMLDHVAGIITDEGGITCHAAIIARELNIPCIVGTKVATQVFKNGDEVELNADDGMVKLL